MACLLFAGDGDDARPTRLARASDGLSDVERQQRHDLARALRSGVRRAAALGGSVEAAVMLDSWPEPLLAASARRAVRRPMRMWSMSKVVTMVALLRALGWDARPGDRLGPEVERALEATIVRSENCPQRRAILTLQAAAGGSPEDVRRAVAAVVEMAGGHARVSTEVAAPDPSCVEYLEGEHEIAEPLAPTVLLGTSTWRIGDAVRFMHALGSDAYGDAVADRVIATMRIGKARSREALPSEFTAPLDWGAGRAFRDFAPAYKAGWGGRQQGEFMAGQIALLELPGDSAAAIAVMFHPDVQPTLDDPGLTAAPKALKLAMESLAQELTRSPRGGK